MQSAPSSPMHRRTFLKGSTPVAAGIAIATPFHALLALPTRGTATRAAAGIAAAAGTTARWPP